LQKSARIFGPILLLLGAVACAGPPEVGGQEAAESQADQEKIEAGNVGVDISASESVEGEEADPEDEFLTKAIEPWKGDLEEMVERRLIRALVAYNRTNYYLDGVDQKGIAYEALREYADKLNKDFKLRSFKIQVAYLPVARDRLIPYLQEGRGDIALGSLTITPERQKLVDFSDPIYPGVKEVIVTHKSVQDLNSLDDLSGREVYVRESSSFYQSLLKLNRSLQEAGQPEIVLTKADENLETEDILEMVDAGLVEITVADDYLVGLWEKFFADIKVHPSLVLRSGASIGWAFRKDSPQLKKSVNAFVRKHKKGTLLGNILINRYLRDVKRLENILTPDKISRFSEMADLFKMYGEKYRFEWLLLAAQGYQESRLDQSTRSRAGALGVMQILPSTAGDPNVNIGQIDQLENNIHAGTKYLRFLADRYFNDPDLDGVAQHLFTLAAYNAGPRRIVAARKRASAMGLDPNKWFGNVEIPVAKSVGRQPVDYVAHIYKYYLSYRLLTTQREAKASVKQEIGGQ
jgi:membrane-bound lytic murein transglycosylase MltF